jgi:hypothetical protein
MPAVTITIPDEVALKIIDDIMANFPEASQTLRVTVWKYKERKFSVEDTEDGGKYLITEKELLKGFQLMFESGKWPKGLPFPPACAEYDSKSGPWDRWLGEADCETHDAFLQLAVLGEVIYG